MCVKYFGLIEYILISCDSAIFSEAEYLDMWRIMVADYNHLNTIVILFYNQVAASLQLLRPFILLVSILSGLSIVYATYDILM